MTTKQKVCLWCDCLFKPRSNGGKPQRFCCGSHRIKFHDAARKWATDAVDAGQIPAAMIRKGVPATCAFVGIALPPQGLPE